MVSLPRLSPAFRVQGLSWLERLLSLPRTSSFRLHSSCFQRKGKVLLKTTSLLAVAFIGAGIVLGYTMASGSLNLSRWARADQPASHATASPSEARALVPATSETGGLSDAQLVALETRNRASAAKAARTGEKPNILCIWGDDIGQANVSAYSTA